MQHRYGVRLPNITSLVRLIYGVYLVTGGVYNAVIGISSSGIEDINQFLFLERIIDSGYLFEMTIAVKIIGGLFLLIPRTAAFGVIIIFPYAVNILIYVVAFPSKDLTLSGILDFATCSYLIYAYMDFYIPMFNSNIN
mgnify:CR=1 FL=1